MTSPSGSGDDIAALFVENRTYPPPPDFAAAANAQPSIYDEDPDAFWERQGRERLSWFTPFTRLSQWDPRTPPPVPVSPWTPRTCCS